MNRRIQSENDLPSIKKIIQFVIFESRWILLFFYLGLIAVQILYCFKFLEKLWELFHKFGAADETLFLIGVLDLLDIAMIAALIKMIVSGSYQTFIEKLNNDHVEKVTSGALKIKMAASLVGVSGINLLQLFMNPANSTNKEIVAKSCIHLIFLVSAMGLTFIEYLHSKSATH